MPLYNFLTLSITLSQLCCLLFIKVRAWKVFFLWSAFPGVTPERCSVAVCLWYAKPIYRLCRRTVVSHHNSQPQDTSTLCLRTAAPKPCTKASILENIKIEMCSRFLAEYLRETDQKLQTLQKKKKSYKSVFSQNCSHICLLISWCV